MGLDRSAIQWRLDPRLAEDQETGPYSRNNIDRGHLWSSHGDGSSPGELEPIGVIPTQMALPILVQVRPEVLGWPGGACRVEPGPDVRDLPVNWHTTSATDRNGPSCGHSPLILERR